MSVAALIVAAGRGSRMGGSRPKAFLTLGGRPILAHAVTAFLSHPEVTRVVASVSDLEAAAKALGREARRVVLVQGGDLRQDSVRQGLRAIGREEIVLVHDAARPLVPRGVIDAVLDGARRDGAAIPALLIPDTVKRVAADGSVAATLVRDDLRLAQTPQGFRADLLRAAYARAEEEGFVGTDDASIVEHAGGRVMVVEGSPENFKITLPADLDRAEALLRSRGGGSPGAGRA
jgi:2-C-methyl-D-erythritol 4-phosphate cytidylyltransferase